MTPGARVAAAIEILDAWSDDAPIERILTRWGRNNRYAGSKDRAAIRDYVFDVLRNFDSCAWAGAGTEGRALMIGRLRLNDIALDDLFNGQGHAPAALEPEELAALPDLATLPADVARNMPEWVYAHLTAQYGDQAVEICDVLKHRAPVCLRVNLARTTLAFVQGELAKQGVNCETVDDVPTALILPDAPRGIANWDMFKDGLVELQDASSQALVFGMPLSDDLRVLDYCAGGGGKSLAMAGLAKLQMDASDIEVSRMVDIAHRASRAGCAIRVVPQPDLADQTPYDLVLVDAPCTGSGTWRRTPEAKVRLTQEKLDNYCVTQRRIMSEAAELVAAGGALVYATCSVLDQENQAAVDLFLSQHADFTIENTDAWLPSATGDGFYGCTLRKS